MGLVTPAKEYIYVEQVDHNSPLSEDLFKKIGASINWINQNHTDQLGDVVTSILSESDFQSIRGANWVLMQGQDITGSDLAILTGINTLPSMFSGGSMVSANNASMGDVVDGENITHNHAQRKGQCNFGTSEYSYAESGDSYGGASYSTDYQSTQSCSEYNNIVYNTVKTSSSGATHNYAGGVKANFFIKIN